MAQTNEEAVCGVKTLYATDLDGTLLRSDETLSEYTCKTINALVQQGMQFTYATARSYVTASRVTKGLTARIPLIVYNGTFVVDNATGDVLISNFFQDGIHALLHDLLQSGVHPIVYAMIEGKETFSYVEAACTQGMRQFVDSRQNDPRKRPIEHPIGLYEGEAFYITCIDDVEKLEPLYHRYMDQYHCLYQRDIYSDTQWLEIMPKEASKANAIQQLKAYLGCERLVVFGDGKNDADMFEIADVSCAMENAVDELKAIATHVIGTNNEDSVAKWLVEHSAECRGRMMAKVFLICGRICSGKSHYAAKLREQENAVILSCDELTFVLFDGQLGDAHDAVSTRMERYFLSKSVEIVRAGTNVILDWGFWTAKGRKEVKAFYAEHGVECEMHYIDVSPEIWKKQIERRNEAVRNGLANTYIVDDGLMAKLESLFEDPEKKEIDIWYKNEYRC